MIHAKETSRPSVPSVIVGEAPKTAACRGFSPHNQCTSGAGAKTPKHPDKEENAKSGLFDSVSPGAACFSVHVILYCSCSPRLILTTNASGPASI